MQRLHRCSIVTCYALWCTQAQHHIRRLQTSPVLPCPALGSQTRQPGRCWPTAAGTTPLWRSCSAQSQRSKHMPYEA
jgi:hypothetical protein